MTDRAGTGGRGQHSTSDTGNAFVDEVAEALSALARDLEGHDSPESMLPAVVAAAVAMVPGADEGSISAVRDRRRVDAIQDQVRQGPCLDAVFQQQTVRVSDMASEQRWPQFAARAAAAGAASMLSLQLYVHDDNLGALNLYARTPHAFDDDSEQIGLLVAAHAAIAYVGARKEAQFANALINRDLIGQAKGILMERYHISGDRAFLLLVRISQNSNQKLHRIAAELVDSGTIAGPQGLPETQRW